LSSRVALFFDGKNFYRALDGYNETLQIDYERLAAWIVEQVAGSAGTYVGSYYFTGHRQIGHDGPGARLSGFLTSLSYQLGFFIKREPLVRRRTQCRHCSTAHSFYTEKRVDVRLAAEMIQYAAVDSYDIAVLLSGDQDFVPAVEAVQHLGKKVYVATWNGRGLSPELRRRCFGEVNLSAGEVAFAEARRRVPRSTLAALDLKATRNIALAPAAPAPSATVESPVTATREALNDDDATASLLDSGRAAVLADLRDAHSRFQARGGYLSVWYFCNKWRTGHGAPDDPGLRRVMLEQLVTEGAAEFYVSLNKHGLKDEAVRPTGAAE
jgi:uncharacterized LabA/DUF88 family protein